jgi:SAM-dependent methyltransferase
MEPVEAAYARRAGDYIDLLGSIESVHPSDLQVVGTWADRVGGPVLDAGCGPGHWTAYLAGRGVDVRGVDRVSAFVEHARRSHPGVPFAVGDIEALPDPSASVAGVLSWYSVIHHAPEAVAVPLAEFARVVRPGGELLLGYFHGPSVEPFDHAVTTAYRWSAEALSDRLAAAGFDVVESYTRTSPGQRAHGALVARRAGR